VCYLSIVKCTESALYGRLNGPPVIHVHREDVRLAYEILGIRMLTGHLSEFNRRSIITGQRINVISITKTAAAGPYIQNSFPTVLGRWVGAVVALFTASIKLLYAEPG